MTEIMVRPPIKMVRSAEKGRSPKKDYKISKEALKDKVKTSDLKRPAETTDGNPSSKEFTIPKKNFTELKLPKAEGDSEAEVDKTDDTGSPKEIAKEIKALGIEDSKLSRSVLEVIAAKGDALEMLNHKLTELAQKTDPVSQAMAFEIQDCILHIRQKLIVEKADNARRKGKVKKLDEKFGEESNKRDQLAQKRKEFEQKEENKDAVESVQKEFHQLAMQLGCTLELPIRGPNNQVIGVQKVPPLAAIHERVTELIGLKGKKIDNAMAEAMSTGFPKDLAESITKILKKEHWHEVVGEKGKKYSHFALIFAALMGLGIARAAKQEGSGGSGGMMGH